MGSDSLRLTTKVRHAGTRRSHKSADAPAVACTVTGWTKPLFTAVRLLLISKYPLCLGNRPLTVLGFYWRKFAIFGLQCLGGPVLPDWADGKLDSRVMEFGKKSKILMSPVRVTPPHRDKKSVQRTRTLCDTHFSGD